MRLEALLEDRGEAIVGDWLSAVLESYPGKTAGFLKREKDRFRNPAGSTLESGTKAMWAALVSNAGRDAFDEAVDGIVRLRAVQEFKPSEALSFVYHLKRTLRKTFSAERKDPSFAGELSRFESRIDELALAAFDKYTACREQIFEIRVKESRMRAFKLLERADAPPARASHESARADREGPSGHHGCEEEPKLEFGSGRSGRDSAPKLKECAGVDPERVDDEHRRRDRVCGPARTARSREKGGPERGDSE
jgi:hypothetical protein